MKLKRFDQINEEISPIRMDDDERIEYEKGRQNNTDFQTLRSDTLDKLDVLMEQYDKLSKKVAPKYWRITGSNFAELREIKKNIGEFTEITEKDKNNKWVRDQL